MDHLYTYSPEIASKSSSKKLKPYLGLFMLSFGIVLSLSAGAIRWQRMKTQRAIALAAQTQELAQQEQLAAQGTNSGSPLATNGLPTTNNLSTTDHLPTTDNPSATGGELGSPLVQAVAGASNDEITPNSGFGLVTQKDSDQQCQPVVFTIGQPETNSFDHPSDELNWVGALDVLPEYVDPFIVGKNQSSDFPWRTSQDQGGNVVNHIQFEYTGPPTTGQLILSWSPGKSGSANKLIYLDEVLLASTPVYQGEFVEQTWQNMPLVSDKINVSLTPGTHTFTIKSMATGGDPSVWDYIQLTTNCP